MTNPAFTEPLDYDFGEEFNYNRWTPDTEITLTNVPWNNDYRDVVRFENRAELNRYIDAQTGNRDYKDASYARVNAPIRLDIPFNVAQRFNYVRAINKAQPIQGGDFQREFYYFVLDVRYIAPNTTELVLQLDVWSSFIHEIQIGRAYVERGHVGIANEDSFRNNGRDYLAVPEGMDVGAEYQIVAQRGTQFMTPANGYSVLVASTIDLEKDPGTVQKPKLYAATGSQLQGLPSGAQFYIFPDANRFRSFLRSMSEKPWVTQGIISVTAIPDVARYWPNFNKSLSRIGAYASLPETSGSGYRHNLYQDWRYAQEFYDCIPGRYRHLRKFWTYPYMAVEMTAQSGSAAILRPEMWNSPDASIGERISIVPPGQRAVFWPIGYNSLREAPRGYAGPSTDNSLFFGTTGNTIDTGEGLDLAIAIGNFPTFAVVNNGAIAALAQNAQSMAYAFQSADWSQNKALRGNQNAYDSAHSSINTEAINAGIGGNAGLSALNRGQQLEAAILEFDSSANLLMGGIMGGVAGVAGGPKGIALGAAMGAGIAGVNNTRAGIKQGMSQRAQTDQFIIGRNAQYDQIDNSLNNARYLTDSNKALADWAARGDYANQIAGLEAKIQDIRMTQPSISGGFGGDVFNLVHFQMGLLLKWKMIDTATISRIGDYWLRYGYAVQRQMNIPQDFAVMDRFTYWKMAETYIRAARVPEAMKQMLRGVFEKGVTVWRFADDIGVLDPASNKPIPGIKIDGWVPPELPPLPEPEPEKTAKRRRKKMLVFLTNDPNPLYALAGASPGTPANWLETESQTVATQWMDATGQTGAVVLSAADFAGRKVDFMAPVAVAEGGGA